ncbi:hypothetical protein KY358_05075 [Candidatus Woesearchaeota archaeon]|nr:hypothetical protein [Candidatus Woesearchaeota archaeon]
MEIEHSLDKMRMKKSIRGDAGFLLTNKRGGYLSLGIKSRYGGLFFNVNNRVLKIIEEIRISGKTRGIKNSLWNIERKKGRITESFFMPLHNNSLVYELDKHTHIDLLLDIREPYDNSEWGRNYEVFVEDRKIIVKFTKKPDARDGEKTGQEGYTVYLVIEGDDSLHYKKIGGWVKKDYDFDRKRASLPFERYVYDAMKLVSKKIVFSVSENKEAALKNAEMVLHSLSKLKEMQKKYHDVNPKCSLKKIRDKEVRFAFRCAVNSLDGLLVETNGDTGIYAGLPWFFQVWSRDEAISLRAMMLEDEFSVSKKILLKQLKNIGSEGRLPNRPPPIKTGSADAIGWHNKRWGDLIRILSEKKLLQKYFNKGETEAISRRLEFSSKEEVKNYSHGGLASNQGSETWMDSISREGCRIEIQALRLNTYSLLSKLTGNKLYREMEADMKKKVREMFWNGDYLNDGADDSTIRPNIFIAAYIYPELLAKEEWEKCFKNILPKLWLSWGGLSTIEKKGPLFHNTYSGEDPKSYHSGDSWFWINNLAAIVLFRTDKKKFKDYINKIIKASSKEILWGDMVGHHAELSSAKGLRSEGCLCQAWSSAMYTELINEVYGC